MPIDRTKNKTFILNKDDEHDGDNAWNDDEYEWDEITITISDGVIQNVEIPERLKHIPIIVHDYNVKGFDKSFVGVDENQDRYVIHKWEYQKKVKKYGYIEKE